MMTKNSDKKREQMIMFCMDDMVPQNHMLRSIDKAIDWTFIYDLVEEKYCPDNGRPSMDPVMLIKIPFIQYLYGIKSMSMFMMSIMTATYARKTIYCHIIQQTGKVTESTGAAEKHVPAVQIFTDVRKVKNI